MKFYQFPVQQVRLPHFCAGCGCHLKSTSPTWWTLCENCFRWSRIGQHLLAARDLLRKTT